jgi:hypothetical protein
MHIMFQNLMMIALCHHICQYRGSGGQHLLRRRARKAAAKMAANSSNWPKNRRDIYQNWWYNGIFLKWS